MSILDFWFEFASTYSYPAAMRIGFLVRFPFHQEILHPIHSLLRDEFPCLITSEIQAVIDFRPRILIRRDWNKCDGWNRDRIDWNLKP